MLKARRLLCAGMRRLAAALSAFAVACAAPPIADPTIPMLAQAPTRAYEEIAPVAARGDPGTPLPYVYDELRRKAQALGADAVIRTTQQNRLERAPAPYDPPDAPLLGNAYPGVLDSTQPGGFPPAGRGLRTRGRVYVVEGMAIRYRD